MKWENHFTKGIEKKRQGTSINDAILFVKKARIWPKSAKLDFLDYVSISPIDYFNTHNNLSFVDAPA